MPKYRISADIHIVSGVLTGVTIPQGFSVTSATVEEAAAYGDWLDRLYQSGDVVHGIATEYRVVSPGRVDAVTDPGASASK